MQINKDPKVKPFIAVHEEKSREVKEGDIERMMEDAQDMYELCFMGNGVHEEGFAVAHPQIEKNDPLRFFVHRDGYIVVNPEITHHTRHKVGKIEGCLSLPMTPCFKVQRWNKCEVKYLTFPDDFPEDKTPTWSDLVVVEKPLHGIEAQVFQHEIDHLDAIYIHQGL